MWSTVMMSFLADLDLLGLVVIFACVVSLLFMLYTSLVGGFDTDSTPKDENDLPPIVDQKTLLPKKEKTNKKSTSRRRKNREIGSPLNLSNQENIDIQMEGCQKADVVEEMEKSHIKSKKNRNHSPPSRSTAEVHSYVKTVKFYTPLELYVNLNLQLSELYNRFATCILSKEQMRINNFPMECPINPGRAVFFVGNPSPSLNSPNDRFCSRCKTIYKIMKDGRSVSAEKCIYHSGKRQNLGTISNAGPYSCCGNPGTSNGCVIAKQHVSSYRCLDQVPFVKTREKRQNLNFPILALDCEMCYTVQGLEVTRVTLVGPEGLPIYDTFVLPENPILDYNTEYSGITANDLNGVKTTFADVQAFLLKTLTSNTILIGHGLENDLRALQLIHETVIDTSVVFPSLGVPPRKLSLKILAANFLQKTIQKGNGGHDSVEDARTCMELMLLKIQKDISTYVSPLRETFIPVITQAEHHQTYWQRSSSLSINPMMIPFVHYWVPPVGSSCDLY